jgi:hypothetical protein
VVLGPLNISVDTLGQVALPVAVALGKIGLAVALVGFVAATFGAACETGPQRRIQHRPVLRRAVGQVRAAQRGGRLPLRPLALDPGRGRGADDQRRPHLDHREMSVVFSAVALPLTYFPIFLVAVVIAAVAAIPLMIWTRMGQ